MANVMTKNGNMSNTPIYEHVCDKIADMANIDPHYITLGSTCIVLDEETGLQVYMAKSNKQWVLLNETPAAEATQEEEP